MVNASLFGTLPDGREVKVFTITNRYGEKVQLLDYGATIHGISVTDARGNIEDVVLGAPSAAGIPECTYMGGFIGRYSGRVPGGKCVIDGKPWQLEQNNGEDFVHGGSGNYARKSFKGVCCDAENKVVFTLRDIGEGGFGNEMDVVITYVFGDDHCLQATIEMTASETTIVNPTNHSYFNLSVDGDARDLVLRICTKTSAGRGANGAPDGTFCDVTGTPADFYQGKTVREAMATNPNGYFKQEPIGYDEYYIFDEKGMKLDAELSCPENGRTMRVYSDAPGMVFYNPNCRKPEPGKHGKTYSGYNALCLQPGFVPNAVNCPQYDSPVCCQGQTYRMTIRYCFGLCPRK